MLYEKSCSKTTRKDIQIETLNRLDFSPNTTRTTFCTRQAARGNGQNDWRRLLAIFAMYKLVVRFVSAGTNSLAVVIGG